MSSNIYRRQELAIREQEQLRGELWKARQEIKRLRAELRKARRPGKLLFRGWIGKGMPDSVREWFRNPVNRYGSAIAVYFAPKRNNGWRRHVEVREAEGGR